MDKKGFVKKFWRVQEVAEHFAIGRTTVYELVQQGRLRVWHPAGSPGGRGMRILAESVVELEQAGQVDPDKFAE